MNFGGSWYAPYGVVFAASYTVEAGPWTGPVVTQLPEGDPQLAVFGPGTVTSSTGVTAVESVVAPACGSRTPHAATAR